MSSIYLYFAGKDELVHTLVDEGFERWYRRMREVVDATDGTAAERLEAVCRAYIEFGLGNREFYEIMYMFHSDRMARYPKELFRRARRNIDLMAELVEAYAPENAPTPADARIAATALWATLPTRASVSLPASGAFCSVPSRARVCCSRVAGVGRSRSRRARPNIGSPRPTRVSCSRWLE